MANSCLHLLSRIVCVTSTWLVCPASAQQMDVDILRQQVVAAYFDEAQRALTPVAVESAFLPTVEQVRLRTRLMILGGALGVAWYGRSEWWQDGFSGGFREADEGWFGRNSPYGGADKLAHIYANYVGTRLLSRLFAAVGNERDDAIRLGTWATLGTMTAVEVVDGFSNRWRFSREDAAMNLLGAGLGVLVERKPEIQRIFDFRMQYKPSVNRDGGHNFEPFGDYSGQIYLLAVKARGIPALQQYPLLRYLELVAGYGTQGYRTTHDIPGERTRNIYFGIALNLSEVLDQTVFRRAKTRGTLQGATDLFLELVQVPGTAALAGRRLGR